MNNCTSGCPTQNHASYGECLRSKTPRVASQSGDYGRGLKWETEIKEYREARRQGIQPKTTQLSDIREAVSLSQKFDQPVSMT